MSASTRKQSAANLEAPPGCEGEKVRVMSETRFTLTPTRSDYALTRFVGSTSPFQGEEAF